MTILGTVALRKENGSIVQAQVTRAKDKTMGDVRYAVKKLETGEELGFMKCESKNGKTYITLLINSTHDKGADKIHMGRVFSECAFSECRRARSKKLVVNATNHFFYYMHEGFVPRRVSSMMNRYRFKGALQIHYKLGQGRPLDRFDLRTYQTNSSLLALARGVNVEDLTFEEVCITPDLAQEMTMIFQRAVALKMRAPNIPYGKVPMRMGKEGMAKAAQRVLASPLRHDARVIDELQTELLAEYGRQRPPEKVLDLIAAYAGQSNIPHFTAKRCFST